MHQQSLPRWQPSVLCKGYTHRNPLSLNKLLAAMAHRGVEGRSPALGWMRPCPQGWGGTGGSGRVEVKAQSGEKAVMKGQLPSQQPESHLTNIMPAEQKS